MSKLKAYSFLTNSCLFKKTHQSETFINATNSHSNKEFFMDKVKKYGLMFIVSVLSVAIAKKLPVIKDYL